MKKRILSLLCAAFLLLPLLASLPVHGADSTSFDPTRVEVKAKGSGGVPVGTIVAWPVATNPEDMDNWLECNGQSISPSVYPELFAVVGGQTPDLRGLILLGSRGSGLYALWKCDAPEWEFRRAPGRCVQSRRKWPSLRIRFLHLLALMTQAGRSRLQSTIMLATASVVALGMH